MELNLDKCVNLTLNRKQSSIKYLDGTPHVPRKRSAVFFRIIAHRHRRQSQRIMNRIADCTCTCNRLSRLKLFWNKAQTSIKWKVQVFHSILRSKFLYGLETIHSWIYWFKRKYTVSRWMDIEGFYIYPLHPLTEHSQMTMSVPN
jgi:hypothetical protein